MSSQHHISNKKKQAFSGPGKFVGLKTRAAESPAVVKAFDKNLVVSDMSVSGELFILIIKFDFRVFSNRKPRYMKIKNETIKYPQVVLFPSMNA